MASSLNSNILILLAIDDWKSIEDNQGESIINYQCMTLLRG